MPVRIGVIGCGAIGQRRHIPEIARNTDAKLIAVVDINKPRSEEVAAKYGAQAFSDYRTMLKKVGEEIDAVVVATPNAEHAPQTIAALEMGKHVLVEKPMATTREEAREMIGAAKKAKKFLMVGQNQRLMPPHVKAKEVMDSGVLGKILAFRTSFKHPGPDHWSIDGAKSWFFQRRPAVLGVTGDLGIHKADLMRFLLGQEFSEVSGFVTTRDKKTPDGKMIALDDNAYLTMTTEEGVVGSMEISWTNYGAEDNQTIIYGSKAVLYIGVERDFPVVVQYQNGNRDCSKLGAIASNTKQTESGMSAMFVRGILANKAPVIDGNEGYRSLNVILTAMDAAKQGKTLKIKY